MKLVRHILRKTPFYKPLRKLYRKLKNAPSHPIQNLPTATDLNLIRLGSEGCGWVFVDSDDLHGCTIISAGLGEDASFDVEFARKYSARIIIVDPTPRAIHHFKLMTMNFGRKNIQKYVSSGKQPVEAYDLSGLGAENLTHVGKALWNESTILNFFEPANQQHVSHSIVNFQHNYREDTPCIEVQAITFSELLSEFDIDPNKLPLIKLDIEGAEIEVLTHCISQGIKPKQILVEFDELNVPSSKGYERVDQMHELLSQNGYEMARSDGQADFLYLRRG